MDTLIIFGAKYLFLAIPLITVIQFFRLPPPERRSWLVVAVISLPLTFLLLEIAKHVWYNPRPFVVAQHAPLVAHAPDNGFPSDHTILCAALSFLWLPQKKRTALVCFLITILVGLARVLAEVHHVIDIVGSILIAVIGIDVSYFLLRPRIEKLYQKHLNSPLL